MSTQAATTVFLGLGGNLGDPLGAFRRTRQSLIDHPRISRCKSSPLYRNPAVGGPADQPDYLNAVLMLGTLMPPAELMAFCQALEVAEGRLRTVRWGARTLDIDLLFYGDRQIKTAELELPHPRLGERHFVLIPMTALAPQFRHPTSALSMREMLEQLPPVENFRVLNQNW